jgi:hypothetical protein
LENCQAGPGIEKPFIAFQDRIATGGTVLDMETMINALRVFAKLSSLFFGGIAVFLSVEALRTDSAFVLFHCVLFGFGAAILLTCADRLPKPPKPRPRDLMHKLIEDVLS